MNSYATTRAAETVAGSVILRISPPVSQYSEVWPAPPIRYDSTNSSRGDLATPLFGYYRSLEICDAAAVAIGSRGVDRLLGFKSLAPGWDGEDSHALSLQSLQRFSEFFSASQLTSLGVAVFMSHAGNVVINWHDGKGRLIEIEFFPKKIEYFVESSALDDSVLISEDGMSRVYEIIRDYIVV